MGDGSTFYKLEAEGCSDESTAFDDALLVELLQPHEMVALLIELAHLFAVLACSACGLT